MKKIEDSLHEKLVYKDFICKEVTYEAVYQDDIDSQENNPHTLVKLKGKLPTKDKDNSFYPISWNKNDIEVTLFFDHQELSEYSSEIITDFINFKDYSFEFIVMFSGDNQRDFVNLLYTNDIEVNILITLNGYSKLQFYQLEALASENNLKQGHLGNAFIHARIAYESWLGYKANKTTNKGWIDKFKEVYKEEISNYKEIKQLGNIRNKLVHGNSSALEIEEKLKDIDIDIQLNLIGVEKEEIRPILNNWKESELKNIKINKMDK